MKKRFVLFIAIICTLAMVSSAYAKAECPQPRTTAKAPTSDLKKDKPKRPIKPTGRSFSKNLLSLWPVKCVMVLKVTELGN